MQDLIHVYEMLAARCDYPLHLGLTEAGLGSKGIVATTAALSVLLQQGIGDTIRASLTPLPNGDRTEEVIVCQQILQALNLRSFTPQVAACPGCGRTTSTFFQDMADQIQTYLREQMPVWREKYTGVEEMKVAVMGCVVNGPGESKHANIGISLPGTFETPVAPVYVDGKLVHHACAATTSSPNSATSSTTTLPNDMEQPNQSPPALPDSEIARLREPSTIFSTRVIALERGLLLCRCSRRARLTRPPSPASASPSSTASARSLSPSASFSSSSTRPTINGSALAACVLLGLLVGFVLIGAGEWLRRRSQQAFAQGVAGCGLAIVYISLYAAFAYYQAHFAAAGFHRPRRRFRLRHRALSFVLQAQPSRPSASSEPLSPSASATARSLVCLYPFLLSVVSVFTVAALLSRSRSKVLSF